MPSFLNHYRIINNVIHIYVLSHGKEKLMNSYIFFFFGMDKFLSFIAFNIVYNLNILVM